MKRRRTIKRRSVKTQQKRERMGRGWFDRLSVRLITAVFVMGACFGIVGTRLVMFGLTPVSEPRQHLVRGFDGPPMRGDIYDRNGVLLATSMPGYEVFADPKLVLEPHQSARELAPYLALSEAEVARRLGRSGRFVWLERQVGPAVAQQIHDLGLPGVGVRRNSVRVYPQQQLAAHVLGGVTIDSQGLAGIEGAYEATLAKGKNLTLTLDARVQAALEQTLAEQVKKSEAKAAAGVVMDPNTGEVLALASVPTFDPNVYRQASSDSRFNRALQGVYEMGSTFKLFTVAQALERGVTTLAEEHDCRKPLKVANFTIHDYFPKARHLTTAEVVQYSSNIGAARLAMLLGATGMEDIFARLGLFDRLELAGMRTAKPLLPRQWGPTETLTVSYGHGIAVTPLHVTAAVSALVTDGVVKTPTLVPSVGPQPAGMPVASQATLDKVKGLMHLVVNGGTASGAQVAGYSVGGKTGTAQKLIDGEYQRGKNVSSFVGAAPLDDPQLVALVLIDEGKLGYHTGGRIAAPTYGKLMSRVLPILGIAPTPRSPQSIPPALPNLEPATQMVDNAFRSIAHATINTDSNATH